MRHDKDPGSKGTVNLLQVRLEPLILLVSLVVAIVADTAKWTTIGDVSFIFLRVSLIPTEVASERPFGAVDKVGLTIESNEVGQTVVEGIPEVANTTGFITGVPETMLISSEVSTQVSQQLK